jgi:hypothetical protein
MIDESFGVVGLAIPFEQFRSLPRNPAYEYEYPDGRAVLSPRPKIDGAGLDLGPRPVVGPSTTPGR